MKRTLMMIICVDRSVFLGIEDNFFQKVTNFVVLLLIGSIEKVITERTLSTTERFSIECRKLSGNNLSLWFWFYYGLRFK